MLLFPALSSQPSRVLQVPQKYRTIQLAIDNSKRGDTVLVGEGTYYENLVIHKNIVLASRFVLDGDTSHIARTVINGSRGQNKQRGSTIIICGGTDTMCVIAGFTIQGGTGSVVHIQGDPGFEDWVDGGGIHLEQAGARITHNIISNNTVASVGNITNTGGAAIGTTDSTMGRRAPPLVIIEHNLVAGNIATGGWTEVGGISVVQPAIIRHNTIIANRAMARRRAPGGGIGVFLTTEHEIIVEGNYLRSNVAGFGGGILVGASGGRRGKAVIVNNIISENHAYELGGGIHVAENANALVINNTIVDNTAGSHRNGVNSTASSVTTLVNNIIWTREPGSGWLWSNLRSVNNLSNETPHGINSLHSDPLFVPGDTMYRLLPESPAIGAGTTGVFIGGNLVGAPPADYLGTPRIQGEDTQIDLGAMDSRMAPSPEAQALRESWQEDEVSHVKVTWNMRQVADPVYGPDSLQILRAGRVLTRIILNDSAQHSLEDASSTLTITLPPGDNQLEVEVVARGRKLSNHLYAVVRLEGLDEPGLVLQRTRDYAHKLYRAIPPGSYVLAGYAGDETGFIDKTNRRRINIVIEPYWYQRWWAYTLLILVVTVPGSIAFASRIARLRSEKLTQQRLTEQQMNYQEAERKRLAAELHDGVGQGLLSVNSEIRQLLLDEPTPSEDLKRIAGLVQESIDEVREISAKLHPHHIERFGLCAAVEALVEKLRHSSGLTIVWRCDEIDPLLSKEDRLHIYRVIQEALANIVKHANATNVRLDVCREDGHVSISVTDDGIGFDGEIGSADGAPGRRRDIARGFGLASMAERARIIGGTLTVSSARHSGTRILLNVPEQKG